MHINQSAEHESSTVNGDEARSQIGIKSKWKETKNKNKKRNRKCKFRGCGRKYFIINSLVSGSLVVVVVATARHENERMRGA